MNVDMRRGKRKDRDLVKNSSLPLICTESISMRSKGVHLDGERERETKQNDRAGALVVIPIRE